MNGELPAPPPSRNLPAHRLALRREHLLDEIWRPGASANAPRRQRAWKLRPRRSRLVLAVAIFVLLAVVGTAVGVGVNLLNQQERFDEQRERIPGEPKRIGPLVEITSGPGWSLVAWRSNGGICLDFVVPKSSSGGCGFGVRGEPRDTAHASAPPPTHWISGGTSSQPGAAMAVSSTHRSSKRPPSSRRTSTSSSSRSRKTKVASSDRSSPTAKRATCSSGVLERFQPWPRSE
jgi:hypothetical protein